jgi:fluoroacetyl-CoA thioesterase
MSEGLRPGLIGNANILVSDINTAERFGNAGAKVYATPMLVALMEQAAIDAIHSTLLPSEGSVGTKIEMQHLAATPVGMTVTAQAELVEITGRKLIFDIVASDDMEVVGKCRHERFVVGDMAAFLAKTAKKTKLLGE